MVKIYKLRHVVEKAFFHLKRWRYSNEIRKECSVFLAEVHIRYLAFWYNILLLYYLNFSYFYIFLRLYFKKTLLKGRYKKIAFNEYLL